MAIVVLVVVVLVLAGLVATGVWPQSHTSSTRSVTYSAASALAEAAAGAVYGGSWLPVYATALNSRSSQVRPFIGDNGDEYGCAFQPPSSSRNVTIPAASGNISAGSSLYWLFALRNTTGAILAVSVIGGTAAVFGLGNFGCQIKWWPVVGGAGSEIPPSMIDSSTAMTLADAAGGTAFLHEYPYANVTMQLVGNTTQNLRPVLPPHWLLSYSTCPVDAAPYQYTANENLTWTAFVYANGTVTTEQGFCPVPLAGEPGSPIGGFPTEPLSTALSLGSSVGASGMDSEIPACATTSCQFYNFSITAAATNLPWGDLYFGLRAPSGSIVLETGGVAITLDGTVPAYDSGSFDNTTGSVFLGYAYVNPGLSTNVSQDVNVSTLYHICLFEVSGPPLTGDYLVATPVGQFLGPVEAPID